MITNRGKIVVGLQAWLRNHPEVWETNENGVPHWWWVQNALGSTGVLPWDTLYRVEADLEPKTHEPELE